MVAPRYLDLRSRVGQLRSAVQTLVLGGNGSAEAILRLKHARPQHGCPPWRELEEQIALIDSIHTMSRQVEKNLRQLITSITSKSKTPGTTRKRRPRRKTLLGWAMKHPRQILEIFEPFHADDEPGKQISIAKEAGLAGPTFYTVFRRDGTVYYKGGSTEERLSSPFFECRTILQFAAWALCNLRVHASLTPTVGFEFHAERPVG